MTCFRVGWIFILLTSALSCTNDYSTEKENQLSRKIDSLSSQVNQLQKQIADSKDDHDTTSSTPAPPVKTAAPVVSPVQKPIKNPTINPSKNQDDEQSEFYYYKGSPKRVSVEITPWINSRRKVIFYDPFGKITYTCEDVKLSYSVITRLKKFHDNGSVSLIEIGDNPGASRYWYETQINFGINNEPQWKTINKKPEMTLEESINNKYWWNDKTKQWIKQETVKEQPYRGK